MRGTSKAERTKWQRGFATSPKRVMAFGTFDILHLGHLEYLRQAKRLGGKLTVVVTSDRWAAREKGRKPSLLARERARLVSALKPVDHVLVGGERDKLDIVARERPDVIVLGYDCGAGIAQLGAELANMGLRPRIVRARAFKAHRYKGKFLRKALSWAG